MNKNFLKVLRFVRIYGPRRTFYKAAGRLRLGMPLGWPSRSKRATVGVIGCGQFAFSTIGYYLDRLPTSGIAACYDIDEKTARTFSKFHRVKNNVKYPEAVISDPAVETIYIASNHASHANYAISALAAGKTVYLEKPVAVSLEQLKALHKAVAKSTSPIFAGYNRPFSKTICFLRNTISGQQTPLTLSCFISGHQLAEDHWYRKPDEGTRVCGNIGHWLDLAVHILHWSTLPDRWTINLTWSDNRWRDDNMSISMASERGDLLNIVLTARTEPFEGINESINLQWGDAIVKIDDFRRMTIWKGDSLIKRKFWPKDVGHGAAIHQPYTPSEDGSFMRDWREVVLSSLLTLRIMQMVRTGEQLTQFSFKEALAEIESDNRFT